MIDALCAASIRITGADSQEIEAYFAHPDADVEPGPRGGIVMIHHMPGFDAWTKEVARRFATHGYNVVVPNLYWREAPGAEPDDAAAVARAGGGVPDARLIGDVGGAIDYLRALPSSNGKVGVIGHCSGGRQSVLAACNLPLDAAVDCYGAFVVGTPPAGSPMKVGGIEDQLGNLGCPLLGLFGEDDQYPSPDQVAELDRLLTGHGKEHEFHSYPGAGHAFFATDRTAYRVEAALDGYAKIDAFFAQHLAN
ncbi:MAG: dienelactone hydrolase family protein [Frankiales bacterium]|nr:dienelactone hydrolase family protein [Frankiales bacterium]